MFNMFLPAKTL